MKKTLRILTVAVMVPMMVSLMAASCKKQPKPNPVEEMPVLQPTVFAEYITAGTVGDYDITTTSKSRKLVSYDFNGSGTATLGFKEIVNQAALTKAGEAVIPDYYEVHPYTAKDGAGNAVDYSIEGFGTITIELKEEDGQATAVVTIKEDGEPVIDNVEATVPEQAPETVYTTNICRDWKPTGLFIEGSGTGIKQTVGRRFTGCDINEILAYLKEKGLKLDSSKYPYHMNVDKLSLSSFGAITVSFVKSTFQDAKLPVRAPYVYNCDPAFMADPAANFGAILKGMVKDITIKDDSTASIKVNEDETCDFAIFAHVITKTNEEYQLKVEMTLEKY
ncbi:MAG: hypothetical protein J6X89_08555 [Bacteroidales bacterium]|nr:hypothetical protein [Bacteroidales bacterium]